MPGVRSRCLALATTVLALALLSGCASGDDVPKQVASSSAATRTAATSPAPTAPSSDTTTGPTADPAESTTSPTSPTSSAGARYALFFGDSNFVGGGCSPDPQQDMARIAGDLLGYRSVIRGAGGTGFVLGNTDYGLPNFQGQIAQGAIAVSPAPHLVVVEGGSNDSTSSSEQITSAAVTVLQTIRSTYPDAILVVMGPIDVRAGQGDVTPAAVAAVHAAADQVGVPFLDAYSWLPWRTTTGLVCTDYDHATEAGQQIIGQRLAAELSALGA